MLTTTAVPFDATDTGSGLGVRAQNLLSARAVLTAVQPMVDLASSELVAHELLARPRRNAVSSTANTLIKTAESCGVAAQLSRKLREDGLAKIAGRIIPGRLFVNTHPAELEQVDRYLDSLAAMVERHPEIELTVEIPEDALIGLDIYLQLRQRLHALGVSVAFDGFGEGRSRLPELAAAPPDFVKFGRATVRGIGPEPRFRERVLKRVLEFVHSIGALPIAVGVETADELAACRALGFSWAQGFLVGRPWTVAA